MFTTLTYEEKCQLRDRMTDAAGLCLDEAQAINGILDCKLTREIYGADASTYLSMLAEFVQINLDTYPPVVTA